MYQFLCIYVSSGWLACIPFNEKQQLWVDSFSSSVNERIYRSFFKWHRKATRIDYCCLPVFSLAWYLFTYQKWNVTLIIKPKAIIEYISENKLTPTAWIMNIKNGNTALFTAERIGYISSIQLLDQQVLLWSAKYISKHVALPPS